MKHREEDAPFRCVPKKREKPETFSLLSSVRQRALPSAWGITNDFSTARESAFVRWSERKANAALNRALRDIGACAVLSAGPLPNDVSEW
jgi:hypothetical protein